MQIAADDGDALADSAIKDEAEENGFYQLPPLKRGQEIVVFTATFFYRGKFLGEDVEYIALEPGSYKVYETGALEDFFKNKKGTQEERLPKINRIRKGSIVSINEM
jgi:hypothetical protein